LGGSADERGGEGGGEWNGLVCVHAQEKAVTTWGRNGFRVDRRGGVDMLVCLLGLKVKKDWIWPSELIEYYCET